MILDVLLENCKHSHKLFAINAQKVKVQVSIFTDKNFTENWDILKDGAMKPVEFLFPAAAQLKKLNIKHLAEEG